MTSTRLDLARYLELLAADGERLATAAEGHLEAAVPSCPGWDVADAVCHTGAVYHHKINSIVLDRFPTEGESAQGPADGEDLLTWFRASLAGLLHELTTRDPDAAAPTWYPPEQTVAWFYRRMAQETAVHRVDVELASGVVTPVADDLALDGVDEVLDLFLRYGLGTDPDEDIADFAGRSVQIRTGHQAWHVVGTTGDPTEQIRLDRGVHAADASVSGEPSELLLWLWNRRPDSAVRIDGDPQALAAFRGLLARATV